MIYRRVWIYTTPCRKVNSVDFSTPAEQNITHKNDNELPEIQIYTHARGRYTEGVIQESLGIIAFYRQPGRLSDVFSFILPDISDC